MITEDYISFETAKLLKEKGFDENITTYRDDFIQHGNIVIPLQECLSEDKIKTPTLQMAIKWLREVHNIHVVPKIDFYAGDYTGRIYDGRRESTGEKDDYIAIAGNSTYEEACEAAIKYCLENLI